MRTNTLRTLIIIIIVVCSLLLFVLIFERQIYHSYLSVAQVCFVDFEIPQGYAIVGKVTQDAETKEITKTIYSPDVKTLKHEHCHEVQFKRGFPSMSCSTIIGKYISEFECYTVENLDDYFYQNFYGNYT